MAGLMKLLCAVELFATKKNELRHKSPILPSAPTHSRHSGSGLDERADLLILNGFSDSASSARFSAFTGFARVRSKKSISLRLRVNALSRAISAHHHISRENFGTHSRQLWLF